ncbi:MAG: 30S ribosomal protein S21 [bacterium]|nr:30S ribosomal protein S21 [bacterium]
MAINVQVKLSEGMSQDKLHKKFLKKVKNENVIREYLDRTSFYLSPSEKRRAKQRKNKFLRLQKRR